MPEQPPPTTRILRPHSGLPSSSRRSSIFLAAVSVNVIIRPSLSGFSVSDGSPRVISIPKLENAARGKQGELLEGGVRVEGGHQERGGGHLVGPQHEAAVGGPRDG